MNIRKSILAASMVTLCSLPALAAAQEPTITINARSDHAQPIIVVRSKFDFEKAISLKMQTDPSLGASDVLIRAISKLGMIDAHGITITSGFDVDVVNNLVVAFSGGTSEIIRTARTSGGFQVIGSFKDRSGNFVSPPVGSLAVYNTSGEKLCFEYETQAQASPKMVFTLLIDRSGSMYSVMDDVKASAQDFLSALPPASLCSVASFNQTARYHNSGFQSCNSGNFQINAMEADGGTNLQEPLMSSYQMLDQSSFEDYQKAVIIITDGIFAFHTNQADYKAVKKDTLTFAYLLGNHSDELLKGIADGYLHDPKNVKTSLERYFGALSAAYTTQKVLNVRPCQGGLHAAP